MLLRYPSVVDLDPRAFVRRTRAKLVNVHHTKEVEEMLGFGRAPGVVARALLERFNGRRVLSRVAGIAAVTNQIRRCEVERAGHSVPWRVIANGIDVSRVPQTGFAPFDGREYVARGMPLVYAEAVSREQRLSDEMRAFALRHLDWGVKKGAFHELAHEVA